MIPYWIFYYPYPSIISIIHTLHSVLQIFEYCIKYEEVQDIQLSSIVETVVIISLLNFFLNTCVCRHWVLLQKNDLVLDEADRWKLQFLF